MVYSQTKRTSSIASITNQPQGGGCKKAGFPHTIGRDSWTSIYMRGTAQSLPTLQMTIYPNVSQSRPIGTRPSAARYFNFV